MIKNSLKNCVYIHFQQNDIFQIHVLVCFFINHCKEKIVIIKYEIWKIYNKFEQKQNCPSSNAQSGINEISLFIKLSRPPKYLHQYLKEKSDFFLRVKINILQIIITNFCNIQFLEFFKNKNKTTFEKTNMRGSTRGN